MLSRRNGVRGAGKERMGMFRGAVVTLSACVAAAIMAQWPAMVAAADQDGGAPQHIAYGRHLAAECTSCHRSDTMEGAVPVLAGRPAAEIVALLKDFRDGRKSNAVMVSVAKSLNEEEAAAVAAYFASLPAPDRR